MFIVMMLYHGTGGKINNINTPDKATLMCSPSGNFSTSPLDILLANKKYEQIHPISITISLKRNEASIRYKTKFKRPAIPRG